MNPNSYNVTAEQFVLLGLLAEEDGITQQELGRRAASDPNTVRAILLLLENNELITRDPHPEDGRARSVALTDRGRQTYVRLSKQLKPLQDRLVGLFAADDADALVEFLGRVSDEMMRLERRRHRAETAAGTTDR